MLYKILRQINVDFQKLFNEKHQFRITTFVKMAQVSHFFIE